MAVRDRESGGGWTYFEYFSCDIVVQMTNHSTRARLPGPIVGKEWATYRYCYGWGRSGPLIDIAMAAAIAVAYFTVTVTAEAIANARSDRGASRWARARRR